VKGWASPLLMDITRRAPKQRFYMTAQNFKKRGTVHELHPR
jgi:hypothetical protein